jgi:ABC-type enterochelin transport system substrate-binding protein
MKRDPDYFADTEPTLVFIAKRLRDALSLEALLTSAGVDYAVETDEYHSGMIFRSTRMGAFFYVRPEVREQAAALMLENGYVPITPRGASPDEKGLV